MQSFTPESRVLAAFTVVVALVLGGWQSVAMLTARLLGPLLPGWSGALALLSSAVLVVLAVALMRYAATAAVAATTPWARHLGHATALLGFVVILASGVYFLGSVVNSAPGLGLGYTG